MTRIKERSFVLALVLAAVATALLTLTAMAPARAAAQTVVEPWSSRPCRTRAGSAGRQRKTPRHTRCAGLPTATARRRHQERDSCSGTNTFNHSISTQVDTGDEACGYVTVHLLPGDGYQLGAYTFTQVQVRDQDQNKVSRDGC